MKSDYNSWIVAYFAKVTILYDIVKTHFPEETDSDESFDKFARMVYEKSSKEISMFLEPLTKEQEMACYNYILNVCE